MVAGDDGLLPEARGRPGAKTSEIISVFTTLTCHTLVAVLLSLCQMVVR